MSSGMLGTVQKWWNTRGTDLFAEVDAAVEFHGSKACGWTIAVDRLGADSVVLSFGIGEDITFDQSLIARYGCAVHAFDPTPKALAFVARHASDRLIVHDWGLGARDETRTFHLPKDPKNVSGSVSAAKHLRSDAVEVALRSLPTTLRDIGVTRFELLKLDIEGSEYEVLRDEATLAIIAEQRPQVLIEFHHRFEAYDKADTQDIVARLRGVGYRIAWVSRRGEEALFLPDNADPTP